MKTKITLLLFSLSLIITGLQAHTQTFINKTNFKIHALLKSGFLGKTKEQMVTIDPRAEIPITIDGPRCVQKIRFSVFSGKEGAYTPQTSKTIELPPFKGCASRTYTIEYAKGKSAEIDVAIE